MQFVYVCVSGPDPKDAKASQQTFAASRDGVSQLSASGIMWEKGADKIQALTPATVISPFIRASKRRRLGECHSSDLVPLTRYLYLCSTSVWHMFSPSLKH